MNKSLVFGAFLTHGVYVIFSTFNDNKFSAEDNKPFIIFNMSSNKFADMWTMGLFLYAYRYG